MLLQCLTWTMWLLTLPSCQSKLMVHKLAPTATLHPVFDDNYVHSKQVASVYAGLTYMERDGHGRSLHSEDHNRLVEEFQSQREYSRYERHQRNLKLGKSEMNPQTRPSSGSGGSYNPRPSPPLIISPHSGGDNAHLPKPAFGSGGSSSKQSNAFNNLAPSGPQNSIRTPRATRSPTSNPTKSFIKFTASPTTDEPTIEPTASPTTAEPTIEPTAYTTTAQSSIEPTAYPTTAEPSIESTAYPTATEPTIEPTAYPTTAPPTTTSPTTLPLTVSPTDPPTLPQIESENNEQAEAHLPNSVDDDDGAPESSSGGVTGSTPEGNTMHGGLYNSFQTAPLSQGVGTHYASVWIGTPTPQRSTVIVDTGSHFTAFPCTPCIDCGEIYHTDNYFDTSLSVSYEEVSCADHCSGKCVNNHCQFSQSYSEGSSWIATLSRDHFFCSSEAKPLPQDKEYSISFRFGCQTHLTGLFNKQLADGIMGMSAHETTLPHQLNIKGKLEHDMFSMCFSRGLSHSKEGVSAGIMALGGADTRHHTSPMVYARNMKASGWYTVFVKNIYLRHDDVLRSTSAETPKNLRDYTLTLVSADVGRMNSGKGVIVDSGTTDTYLHSSLRSSFAKAWKEATGNEWSKNKAVTMTEDEVAELPTIMIQLEAFDSKSSDMMDPNEVVGFAGSDLSRDSPRDVLLAVSPQHYMEYDPQSEQYTNRIYFTESSGGVLGANAMMGHDILFDWENKRVGFAESQCDYSSVDEAIEVGVGNSDVDEHNSLDCELGVPSIKSSCLDNVKFSDCVDPDADLHATIDSVEVWTMIIENSGSTGGLSCEEVAINNTVSIPDQSVFCQADGTCTKIDPCKATCKDVLGGSPAIPIVTPNVKTNSSSTGGETDDYCGDNMWGSCQFSCEQSKIVAKLMSDGLCHETESISRDCHIDECGRSDPCRVPFVVHSIIAFSGAKARLWDKKYETIFADSFALSVNSNKESFGDQLIAPGDVKVLSATDWYANTNIRWKPKEPDGMQVVVEVSIFNSNAKLPEIEGLEEESDISLADAANFTPSWKDRVNDIVHEVEDVFHGMKGPPLATCNVSDVYSLAKTASDVHVELGRNGFMKSLLDNIQNKIPAVNTPFSPVFLSREHIGESKVLSSWTIKTEVEMFSENAPLRMFTKENFLRNWKAFTTAATFLFAICYCGVCCGTCCTRLKMRKVHRALKASKTMIDNMKTKMKNSERMSEKGRGKYAKVNLNGEIPEMDDDISGDECTTEFHDHPQNDGDLELPDVNTRMKRLSSEETE